VYEYGQYSIRGPSELTASGEGAGSGLDREYAFRWSNGIFEPITLFIPQFYGGASIQSVGADSNLGQALRDQGFPSAQVKEQTDQARTYWGQQPFTGGPYYAGAIICFLFVLGILFAEKKLVYWLVAGVVLSILLSWGKNFESFNYFMFEYFPGYNKFRAVSMAIIVALVCLPLLGFLGLENLFREGLTKKSQRKLLIAAAIPGGFGLLVVLFAGIGDFMGASDQAGQLPEWYLAAIKADRESLMRTDAIRSLFFLIAFVAVLILYFKNKLSAYLALPILTALILVDVFAVSKRYLNEDDFERNPIRSNFQPTEADAFILKDPSPNYRVLTLLASPWSDANTSYYHKSLGGYHGAKMRRYNDLIEHCITPEFSSLIQSLREGNTDLGGFGIINMLNTKYLIAGTSQNAVLKNDHAKGNAWFASGVREVQSPDEEIAATCEIATESIAVIDASKFSYPKQSIGPQGNIELVEYSPNYLKYSSSNQQQGLALFSEMYYPKGWEATIDGQPADILRANYIFRALDVPAGDHTIEFSFKPASYFIGNRVMMVASILTLLLLVLVVSISMRKILSPVPTNEHAA
ncbi:MAG: YfhO family protein, partial [Cyclobacteriaceae bacterium]